MEANHLPGVLSAYIPASWFDARGIYKVLAKLLPRLPDVSKKLFLTFTVNPALFESPQNAFDDSRDRLRKIFFKLRRGVKWQGKIYRIDSPYCVKVEFHRSGWAHFHVIFLTGRFLPGELLNELWALGRTNVQRITNKDFHYLLKYVTKGGGYPEWILERNRLRVFQPSRGFLRPVDDEPASTGKKREKQRRRQLLLGQRLEEWKKSATYREGDNITRLRLEQPFREAFDRLVFSVASDGRYLGGGKVKINDRTEILPWITKPKSES